MNEPMVVSLPGSKSITARALFCAAAADGVSRLCHPLVADDTTAFFSALTELGYATEREAGDATWTITGSPGGPPSRRATLDCRDAGTAARFLPCLVAAGAGIFDIDASAQMRARPMAPLVAALRSLGVEVDAGPDGRLPLHIVAHGVEGGHVSVDGTSSSQFLTALCLMAPLTRRGLTIAVTNLVSRPFVDMTLQVMKAFGVTADRSRTGATDVIHVEPQTYRAIDYTIEPDASTASYLFAAAAVTGEGITIPRLGAESVQGDLRFVDILRAMGSSVEIVDDATTVIGSDRLMGAGVVNMREIPDMMMTLAAIAPLAITATRIEGVANARLKESDRLAATADNLARLGVPATTGEDWIEVHPATPVGAEIACHRDHRLAMSFSVLGLRVPGITLDDPLCVAKTFPGFHTTLAALRASWNLDTV